MTVRVYAGIGISLLMACTAPRPSPRESLRYGADNLIPYGRLHAEVRLDTFAARWASDELTQMKEPRLDPSVIEGEVFRMLYQPSFSAPIAIRVIDVKSGCILVRKGGDSASAEGSW